MIEDDEICAFVNRRVLEKTIEDLEVEAFINGKLALDHLIQRNRRDQLPDFILLDINMPVMSGWDFLKEYESLLPDLKKTPRIYMVSSTMYPEELKKIDACALVAGFMSKPFNAENAMQLQNVFQQI